VLAQIESAAKEPPPVREAEVEVMQVGSGGIVSRWVPGVRPEAVQEIKAVALPILVMIGKALGITLGFALWSPKDLPATAVPAPLLPTKARTKPREISIEDARTDIKALIASKSEMPKDGRGFARRWRVHDSTAGKYLDAFKKEGLIRRVQSGPHKLVVAVQPNTNGSGKSHVQLVS
jgi:hypothetical protein